MGLQSENDTSSVSTICDWIRDIMTGVFRSMSEDLTPVSQMVKNDRWRKRFTLTMRIQNLALNTPFNSTFLKASFSRLQRRTVEWGSNFN